MKIAAVVQARMGSTRLPGKVMRKINGLSMLEILVDRLRCSQEIHQIIIATSENPENHPLVSLAAQKGLTIVEGSEDDVLSRFILAADVSQADVIVRITGDCPVIDPNLVDYCIRSFKEAKVDYLSNIEPPTYPDGLDIEVVSVAALKQAHAAAYKSYDREHVTPYVRNSGLFRKICLKNEINYSELRWTVDEYADFQVISQIFAHFYPNIHFSWLDILKLYFDQPQLFEANKKIIRNEGADMGSGQKLWKRAKQIIPGGGMLLSKRSEMFLPENWPSYYSKAKGCDVWDLDGNRYVDMTIMGVGTNILGYACDEVDRAVIGAVNSSNMSTFNCAEEVLLAEKLIEINSWADMVRFARTGGEANAIAIRIARAASARDKIAVCGYHGWHDWYLSANITDEEMLAGHLLPGLSPKGVPHSLRDTVFPFAYNNIDELKKLVEIHEIGAIKMEVVRNKGPENNFLAEVRELASSKGIVLIFDECTSGFRQTYGGIHKLYNVEPDIAIFGKALGNGYAITAIVGRRKIMEAAQSTFISSTFWTERVGPTAALKTLEVMESIHSWDTITNVGLKIRAGWQDLANKYGLQIDHWGIPALTGFSFKSRNNLIYKTIITQEMLSSGYLAGNSVYVSTAHNQNVLDGYFDALDPVFNLINQCEDGLNPLSLLKGPICHDGFKRLN